MKEAIVRLSEDELKLIDYCMMLCLINSERETKLKQQAKILIAKLRKIISCQQQHKIKIKMR